MSEFEAVEKVLHMYLDGLYHSDTERLRQVFHPQARYICATEPELINYDMARYLPIVDARESPASRNDTRVDTINSIAFAGPNTAFAQLNCAVGERYFTDFLTLIRVDHRWQIISKVFHFDLR